MAANEALSNRVRRAHVLGRTQNRLRVRLDPELHDKIVRESKHCTTVVMRNREWPRKSKSKRGRHGNTRKFAKSAGEASRLAPSLRRY